MVEATLEEVDVAQGHNRANRNGNHLGPAYRRRNALAALPRRAKRRLTTHRCSITRLFENWDFARDKSERAAPGGPSYLYTRTGEGTGTIKLLSENDPLTGRLLEVLAKLLGEGQSVVSMARYHLHRGPGEAPLSLLTEHGDWVVKQGRVLKVRQLHQHNLLPRPYYRAPDVLKPDYTPPGTSLVYPFVPKGEVFGLLDAE